MHMRQHSKRAQAIVEFALVIPILMMIFLGVVDFARYFLLTHLAQSSAREMARRVAVWYGTTSTTAAIAATTGGFHASGVTNFTAVLVLGMPGVSGTQTYTYTGTTTSGSWSPGPPPLPIADPTTVPLQNVAVTITFPFQPIFNWGIFPTQVRGFDAQQIHGRPARYT